MRTKSPTVAFFLNFLFPGLGFSYLGKPLLIGAGIVFFLSNSISWGIALALRPFSFDPTQLILGIVAALSMAVMGSEFAAMRNRVPPSVRKCPFCAETVKAEAKVCKHCGRELS